MTEPQVASPSTNSDARFTVSTIRVRYSETDQMGFVYHPNYLVWCEIARTDFMREMGVRYADLESSGWLLAVIEADIRYLAPARYDEVITVRCQLDRVQSRSVTFSYQIRRLEPEHRTLAQATTKLVALDRAGAPRTLPADLLTRFRDAAGSNL